MLSRTHPLTVEGERIGNFDLAFTCAERAGTYNLTYKEVRYGPADASRIRFRRSRSASPSASCSIENWNRSQPR